MAKLKAFGVLVALFLAFVFLVVACSMESDNASSGEENGASDLYSIVSDETNAPYKRSVEIVLTQRLNESELESIAREVKEMSANKVDRTFIGYRLESQSSDEAYWATTHYNPELKVRVLGSFADQMEGEATD